MPLHLLTEQLSPPCVRTAIAAPPSLSLPFSVPYLALPLPCWVCFLESSSSAQPLSSPLFLPLLPPCLPSLDSCLTLQPLLPRVWFWAAKLPRATVKDWNVGKAGVG